MKINFIKLTVSLAIFLCSQYSFSAEKESEMRASSELDLIKETRVESKYFSVMVPKGWSFKKFEWDEPHATGKVCNKPKKSCTPKEWVVVESKTIEIAIAPSKEVFTNEGMNKVTFGITISDNIPPQAILGKIDVPALEMGDTALISTESINDRMWILMDRKMHVTPQTNAQSLEASTPFKNRDIKCEALGSPADIVKYRAAFKSILSSLKFKQ